MDDDPELEALRALNARIEALYNQRGPVEDPALDAELDALENEAGELIRIRSDRTLKPILERFDAAMAEAKRLLGDP